MAAPPKFDVSNEATAHHPETALPTSRFGAAVLHLNGKQE
jgi:hypothetical protein